VRDDARAQHEPRARLRVDDEVEVTLAVDLLGVAEAMPLFGQRTQRLRDEREAFNAHRNFAGGHLWHVEHSSRKTTWRIV